MTRKNYKKPCWARPVTQEQAAYRARGATGGPKILAGQRCIRHSRHCPASQGQGKPCSRCLRLPSSPALPGFTLLLLTPTQRSRERPASSTPGRPEPPPAPAPPARPGAGPAAAPLSDSRRAAASSKLCSPFLSGPCGTFRSANPAMLRAAPPRPARGTLGLVVPPSWPGGERWRRPRSGWGRLLPHRRGCGGDGAWRCGPPQRANGWEQGQPSSLGPSALRGRRRAHQVEPRSCSTEASPTVMGPPQSTANLCKEKSPF